MWRTRRTAVLEPGEVEALADAARRAAQHSEPHPRQGLLLAVADALEAMAGAEGLAFVPAPAEAMRRAAVRQVRPHPGRHAIPSPSPRQAR